MGNLSWSIAELWTYPVKSCRGVAMPAAHVCRTGMPHDREWMVVNEKGYPVTQREYPLLALVGVEFWETAMVLNAPGMETITLPVARVSREEENERWFSVRVWNEVCRVVEPEPESSAWFSEFIGQRCRLVRLAPGFGRREKADSRGDALLADTAPLHIITTATLAALESASGMHCGAARFRPNVVVMCEGLPGIEAEWTQLRLGTNGQQGVEARVRKPTKRCEIPSVNPETGARDGKTLLSVLAARGNTAGVYAVPTSPGIVRVGDPVSVLEQLAHV